MHQFLAEPDDEKFFDAIKAYVVTCVVSCRVAKEGRANLAKILSCQIYPPHFASVLGVAWKRAKKRNRAPEYQGARAK